MFRQEAINYRSDRLSGEVALAVPLPWQAVGYLIFIGLSVAIIFLSLASYARVETVSGAILPDRGVAAIMPTRNGIIDRIVVAEGTEVRKGAMLAGIRPEEALADGGSAASRIEAAIIRQDASLLAQLNATNMASNAQIAQIHAQRAGMQAEVEQLEKQITLQNDLVSSARRDLERAQSIASRGFVSGRDLQTREDTLLSRQQQLSQLQQSLASRHASMNEANQTAIQISAQAQAQTANLAAARAEVAQSAANAAGARSYALRAPFDGRVTALMARTGQVANPQSPLMTIVQAKARLRAELSAPSSAIGFVKHGQQVRLALDAFPYQRFGTVKGIVRTVAQSVIGQQGQGSQVVAVYPVTVELVDTDVTAFGERRSLVPGMTLTARIVTEEQTLFEWLFEPLFAVSDR